MRRAGVILEVVAVFALTLAAVALIARSPVALWERAHLLRPFAEYLALALVPLAVILLHRRPLSDWGITAERFSEQIECALRCLIPFAAGKALAFVLRLDPQLAAFAEAAIALAVLGTCAWLLEARPTRLLGLVLLIALATSHCTPSKAFSALVFYPFFLGPAEELLFRGFIQSRLNQAFGRPFHFAQASFGAGLVLTALLFSIFHVLNLPALFTGRIELLWTPALPTFAWGLVFGFLRERTGSVLPPAMVHGVPQAVAWAFLDL